MEFFNLFVSNILNIGIFFLIISRLFQPKLNQNCIYCLFLAELICLCVVNSLPYPFLNAIMMMAINIAILFSCYDGKSSVKIYITIVYICFGMILEMFSLLLIHYIFHMDYNDIKANHIYNLIGIISSNTFLYIVMSMFSKFLKTLSNTKYPKKTILLLCLPITSVLFVISMDNFDNILSGDYFTIFLILIGLLVSNILSFYIFFDIIEIVEENSNMKLKESYEKIDELNYQLLENKYDATRTFVHDIKKHLNIMSQFIKSNDYNALSSYITELNHDVEKTDYTVQTSQKILNIVMSQYVNILEKEHIRIKLDIDEIDLSCLSILEQNIIFSNMLENAIESCIKCTDCRNIILKLKEDKKYIIIKMINSCINANIIDGFPQTLKNDKDQHGFGLKKVKNIVEEHHGRMLFDYDPNLQTFYTSIILPENHVS